MTPWNSLSNTLTLPNLSIGSFKQQLSHPRAICYIWHIVLASVIITVEGYPMNDLKKIPEFKSLEEEAQFWNGHDSTDYIDWSKAKRTALPNLGIS